MNQSQKTTIADRRLSGARRWLAVFAAAACVLWSACAAPRVNARPVGWSESFAAACYPAEFAGRRTVSGEPYDPEKLTAAHPSLPLGTVVEVSRRGVEQTTVTRINDRPPLDGPQAMRLSRAAAAQLGIDCGGTVEVRLTVLKEPAEE